MDNISENNKIEKSLEILISSVEYYDIQKEKTETVKVKIEINYLSKTFNVKTANDRDVFKFMEMSHQSEMWKATCKAIVFGIEEAEKILKSI